MTDAIQAIARCPYPSTSPTLRSTARMVLNVASSVALVNTSADMNFVPINMHATMSFMTAYLM